MRTDSKTRATVWVNSLTGKMPKQYFCLLVISSSTFFLRSSPSLPFWMPSMSFSYPRTYYNSIRSKLVGSPSTSPAGMLSLGTICSYVLGMVMFLPMSEVILTTLSLRVMVFMHALMSASRYSYPVELLYSLLSSQQPSSNSMRPLTLSLLQTSTSSVYFGSERSAEAAGRSRQASRKNKREDCIQSHNSRQFIINELGQAQTHPQELLTRNQNQTIVRLPGKLLRGQTFLL